MDSEFVAGVGFQSVLVGQLHGHLTRERRLQAALASASSFSLGSAMPLLVVLAAPLSWLVPSVIISSLLFLGVLGAIGARTGGANVWRATARVLVWGAAAMLVTAAVGRLFGVATG